MSPLMRRSDGCFPVSRRFQCGRADSSAVLTAKARSAAAVTLAKAEHMTLPCGRNKLRSSRVAISVAQERDPPSLR